MSLHPNEVLLSVPPLSIGPPLSVSPVKPDAPAVKSCVWSSTGTFVCESEPPLNVTWKPVLLKVEAPKPTTVTVLPAGKSPSIAVLRAAAV